MINQHLEAATLSEKITQQAIASLQEFIALRPDAREVRKALAVKLVYQGYLYEEIQTILDVSLVEIFVKDIQNHLEITKAAIATQDFGQIAREAHQIKGASANLGVTTMHLAAEKLEQLVCDQECRGMNNLISELEEFVKRIQEFLIKKL